MAKAKKEPNPPKEKKYNYYGFNVKSNLNLADKDQNYFKLVRDIFNKDVHVAVAIDKKITLRTQFSKEVRYKENEHKIIYGNIVRYAIVEGNNWYSEKKKEFQEYVIPADLFPSGFETEYIFLPSVHRFFVRVNGRLSPNLVLKFLISAFSDIAGKGEIITVNLMQSRDVIDRILNADSIQRLHVKVSYTNDDIADAAQTQIDKLLKAANANEADVTFKANENANLDKDSVIIKGFVELSKDNGEAEATVTKAGKTERIVTKSHPAKLSVETSDEATVEQELLVQQLKAHRE